MLHHYFYERVMINAPAGADHYTYDAADATMWKKPIDVGLITFGSAHFFWAGLTGATLNATVQFLISNHPNPGPNDWDIKRQANMVFNSPDGNSFVSLNGVVAERWYAIRYLHAGVTGGTINCYFNGK